jgi:hypothetical protein
MNFVSKLGGSLGRGYEFCFEIEGSLGRLHEFCFEIEGREESGGV